MNRMEVLIISNKYDFSDKSTLTADVSYTYHEQDPETQFYKFTLNQYMTGKDRTYKGVLTYNHSLTEKFQMIMGVEYENTESIPAYANDEVLGSPEKYEGENAKAIDDSLTITENRWAMFSQFSFHPFSKLKISAGVRYDYSDYNDNTFNPRVGLIYQPTSITTLKLMYGTAFQAPSLFYK